MGEREIVDPENHSMRATDPIIQRVQAVAERGDQMGMDRINYLLRYDPFADLPGETPGLVMTDQAAIDAMVSEGGPEVAGK